MAIVDAIKETIGDKNLNRLKPLKLDGNKKKIISKNIKFKNLHRGERCFIIGNGPSTQLQDLSLLKEEITFTVNQAPRNKQFESINTTYHVWSDAIFFNIDRNKHEDMELLKIIKAVNVANNKPDIFYQIGALNMVNEFNLDFEQKVNYFQEGLNFYDGYDEVIDFTSIVPFFTTVVQYAVSLAIYMGFSEIYLLGCDCTGFIMHAEHVMQSNEFQYSYEVSENEKKRMEKTTLSTSMADVLYGHWRLLNNYKILNNYCKKRNINLINCTGGGVLESLSTMKYEDIFAPRTRTDNGIRFDIKNNFENND